MPCGVPCILAGPKEEILNGERTNAQTELYPSSFAERGLGRGVDLVDCSIQRFEP